MSILEKIADIIRDVTQNTDAKITESSAAADIDGWDSLSHIYIIAEIEDAFGIRMTAQEGGSLKKVGDIVQLIESKQAQS